jgi:hypothetical protein
VHRRPALDGSLDSQVSRILGLQGAFILLNDLLNVLLGVVASLIGWLLLTKVLRPRIILGDTIEHVIRKDSSEYYRLTYKNPRIRRVEDVHVTARMFRRVVVRPDGGRIWESTDIPLDEAFRPVLGRYSMATRILRYLRGRRRLIQHVTLLLEKIESGRFLLSLPAGCPPVTHLNEFLTRTDATIEFAVRAADGYSGVYRTVARIYKAQQVSVVDRRELQIASGEDENHIENITKYPRDGRAAMLQAIKRIWPLRAAFVRQRDKALLVATDVQGERNGNEADGIQGGV